MNVITMVLTPSSVYLRTLSMVFGLSCFPVLFSMVAPESAQGRTRNGAIQSVYTGYLTTNCRCHICSWYIVSPHEARGGELLDARTTCTYWRRDNHSVCDGSTQDPRETRIAWSDRNYHCPIRLQQDSPRLTEYRRDAYTRSLACTKPHECTQR